MQIEVAGKLKAASEPALADKFLAFMTGPAFQSIIPTSNWMYPAVMPHAGLPDGFQTLIKPENALLFSPDQAEALRKGALDEWQTALSK
jgi:thiamine transport system substrate-binding protein